MWKFVVWLKSNISQFFVCVTNGFTSLLINLLSVLVFFIGAKVSPKKEMLRWCCFGFINSLQITGKVNVFFWFLSFLGFSLCLGCVFNFWRSSKVFLWKKKIFQYILSQSLFLYTFLHASLCCYACLCFRFILQTSQGVSVFPIHSWGWTQAFPFCGSYELLQISHISVWLVKFKWVLDFECLSKSFAR